MATWSDLLRKLGIGDDDEDEMDELKPESRTSESKARIARDAIEEEAAGESMGMRGAGREYMHRSVGDKASPMTRRDAENEGIDKRNVLREIRKRQRGMTEDEAEKILEELGGVRGYYSKRTMADEDDVKIQEETIRKIFDKIRKDKMQLDEY